MTTDRYDLPLVHAAVADPDLVAVLTELFDDYRSKRPAPTEHVRFDPDLWTQLEELGLTRLTASEESGGSGASWIEGASLLGLAAAAGAPVPLAEHGFLAAWLLEEAGLASCREFAPEDLFYPATLDELPTYV